MERLTALTSTSRVSTSGEPVCRRSYTVKNCFLPRFQPPFRARTDTMGLWAKSVGIFNAIREHGKQSIRSLADRTGLSKRSVHRHLQAMAHRDRYPESPFWETEAGRTWLIRLVVATLLVF